MTRSVHNVTHLRDEEVVSRFAVRERLLESLCRILGEDLDEHPSHTLLVGGRGMGKSLLLRRLAIEVEATGLEERLRVVLLPEELYLVGSVGELWAAAVEQVAQDSDDADLRQVADRLRADPDPVRMRDAALRELLRSSGGRRTVLMVENLDRLFDDQLSGDDGWTLRQALQQHDDLQLVATATTSFGQVERPDEALYGAFRVRDIGPLDLDETRTLWTAVTGTELTGSRVTPIHVLTGGSPRLITILGGFRRSSDLSSLLNDLVDLVDEHTAYFKHIIEELPTAERRVFVAVAELWEPATTAEVATRCRTSTSQASALLARLRKRGALVAIEDTSPMRHMVAERLFQLYFLLRRPDTRSRVRAMVDLLRHVFDPQELHQDLIPPLVDTMDHQSDGAFTVGVAAGLERAIDEANLGPNFSRAELDDWERRLRRQLPSQVAELGPTHRDTLTTRSQIAYCTGQTGNPEQALALLEALLPDVDPDGSRQLHLAIRHQIVVLLMRTGAFERALETLLEWLHHGSVDVVTLFRAGVMMGLADRPSFESRLGSAADQPNVRVALDAVFPGPAAATEVRAMTDAMRDHVGLAPLVDNGPRAS